MTIRFRFSILLSVSALLGTLGGCNLTSGEDPQQPGFTQITFRIESDLPPNGGWLYWYVEGGILYRKGAGESFGPYGVRADCGTHAGMEARIHAEQPAPEQIALIIETVEDDPVVAREEFTGPGQHQLIVLVTCADS